jgi:SAM-dependent methyltransferase
MNDKHSTWEQAVVWLRSQPNHQDLARACYFDDPLIESAKRYHNSAEWEAVRRLLPQSLGFALDVGAGMGIAAYAFAKDGWQVTALEPDPSEIVGSGAIRRLALDANMKIRVVETWGEQLPFSGAQFDVVHCRQVLHHARDLQKLCSEMGRVLKPGGTFIATREHVIDSVKDLHVFLDRHPLHRHYGGENAFTLLQYRAAIGSAGITITHELNPFSSDINLFPSTMREVRGNVGSRLGLPVWMIPPALVRLKGSLSRAPGRLYTFVGKKI